MIAIHADVRKQKNRGVTVFLLTGAIFFLPLSILQSAPVDETSIDCLNCTHLSPSVLRSGIAALRGDKDLRVDIYSYHPPEMAIRRRTTAVEGGHHCVLTRREHGVDVDKIVSLVSSLTIQSEEGDNVEAVVEFKFSRQTRTVLRVFFPTIIGPSIPDTAISPAQVNNRVAVFFAGPIRDLSNMAKVLTTYPGAISACDQYDGPKDDIFY